MIKFRQAVEIRCSSKGCARTIDGYAHYVINEEMSPRFVRFVLPKGCGWKLGRFVPGILHPASGGVPQPGVHYQEPGFFLCCPEHIGKVEEQGSVYSHEGT